MKKMVLAVLLLTAGLNAFTMAPDGSYHSTGTTTMAPDGSYVSGSTFELTPDGSYVGVN